MLQPFKHNVVWAFLAKKWRHQTLLNSDFSGKIGKMEYLRRYFNRLTTSYKCGTCMAHSICLIKLYQITMRKKFRFFVSDYLKQTNKQKKHAIPKSRSVLSESNPISDETLVLIKEKRSFRRQYSQIKDPAVKTCINQLQKQVKEELTVEMQASWKKFCNSVSLESDPSESWRKIKNFLKPKGQRDYPTLRHDDKVAKTNADKAQLFAESVERHFGTESEHFD